MDSLIKDNLEQFCLIEDLVWDLSQENFAENSPKLIRILKETSMQKYVVQTISAAKKYRPLINNILLKLTENLNNIFPIFTDLLTNWEESIPNEVEEHMITDDVEYFKNNANSENKENNFELSALYGAVNVFHYFLSEEIRINSKVVKNAAISGKMDIIKSIISKKKNFLGTIIQFSLISHQNGNLDLFASKDFPKLKTSFHDLFGRSNIHVISKLISLNSTLTTDNNELVEFAIQMESPQLLDFFCDKIGVKLSSDTSNFEKIYKLIFQVKNYRTELISKLLLNGLATRSIIKFEDIIHNPLSLAITNEDEKSALVLLEHGAYPEFYLNSKGKTYPTICLAAKYKLFNLAEKLIPISDVNEPSYTIDKYGYKIYKKNALIYAIKYRNKLFCEKLLQNGADPSYSYLEYSPYSYCCKISNIEFFSLLYSSHRDEPIKKYGFVRILNTPLSCCIKNDNIEMTKLLLDLGYDPLSLLLDLDENKYINHLQYANKIGNKLIIEIIQDRIKKNQAINNKFNEVRNIQFHSKGLAKPMISKIDLYRLQRGVVYTAKIKMNGSKELFEDFKFLHDNGTISDIIKLA